MSETGVCCCCNCFGTTPAASCFSRFTGFGSLCIFVSGLDLLPFCTSTYSNPRSAIRLLGFFYHHSCICMQWKKEFVCCFAAAASMLNLVDQQLTLRNVKKSTELGSLVIGTGARSEEAAAAAASNLVGPRESSVFYVFENTSLHRRCFHQLKRPSTIRPQTFCPSIKNPLVLWYFPMGKLSLPRAGFL